MSTQDDFPHGINHKFAALFFGVPLGIIALVIALLWLAENTNFVVFCITTLLVVMFSAIIFGIAKSRKKPQTNNSKPTKEGEP